MNELRSAQVRRLPVIPKPPHDPSWLLLNQQVGWRTATAVNIEVRPQTGELSLAPAEASLRNMTESSGSFCGLTHPANVSVGPDGSVFLLDKSNAKLKIFDPCKCEFRVLSHFGGSGTAPRQFLNPCAIGICGSNLYVCDTNNHRVSVFSLRGLALRAHWAPPENAGLLNSWEPYSIAFSGGSVYVSDAANGCIHRFHIAGIWETCFPGLGNVSHLATDCHGRVYAVIQTGNSVVRIFDKNGTELESATRPESFSVNFPPLNFTVDANGNLDLRELCAATSDNDSVEGRQVFDLQGNKVPESSGQKMALNQPLFEKNGIYFSTPLDSRIYRCQWHRIILDGEVPNGAMIQVSTFVAETALPDSHIASLPEQSWETNQRFTNLHNGTDCLIRSTAGRYLWLRIKFKSGGQSTPFLKRLKIEFPRISLRRYLPAVFGADPVSADFTDRFLSLFDTTFRSIEKQIDQQAAYYDPLSTPASSESGPDFLSWLASWIGITLERHWPETKRRQYLKRIAKLFHIRGTTEGLRRQLLIFLGWDTPLYTQNMPSGTTCSCCKLDSDNTTAGSGRWQTPPLILEHFQLRRWLFVGKGRLGDQAILWGKRIINRTQLDVDAQAGSTQLNTIQDPFRDPFHKYAHKFSVFVPASYQASESQRRALENLLAAEKPAHTACSLNFVEPRFRIGIQSMIGLDSVVGRYPEGVQLGETSLGHESVLGNAPENQQRPSLEIGKQARVGTTTKLE